MTDDNPARTHTSRTRARLSAAKRETVGLPQMRDFAGKYFPHFAVITQASRSLPRLKIVVSAVRFRPSPSLQFGAWLHTPAPWPSSAERIAPTCAGARHSTPRLASRRASARHWPGSPAARA